MSNFLLPGMTADSQHRTSWCRRGAAGQTPCHWDTGSGNPGTENKTGSQRAELIKIFVVFYKRAELIKMADI